MAVLTYCDADMSYCIKPRCRTRPASWSSPLAIRRMPTMIPVKSIEWPETAPERALTLPARYFYDETIFKAERERIFYPAWHCVGHVNELTEPGQFLTFDILDQSIVA